MTMRLGMSMVLQNHKNYDDREMYEHETRLVIQAEEWGFDIVWPVEHHFFDYAMCPDNMQYLSYLAARTERIQLATGVIILPWNDPMRVVEKMVLLDHLSDGRAVLGLGRGLAQREYRGFGANMSEARDRFNQAAEIILTGLEEGVVEADTTYYKQARVEVRPRPLQSFKGRRYMVCMSPESFEVAGRLGIGAMMFSQASWDQVADNIWNYRELYRKHNNGEEAPPVTCGDFVACYEDKKKAEEVARKHIVGYYWAVMEHYEMLGDHFTKAGKSYQHYAQTAEMMKQLDSDVVVEGFLNANLWGSPDMLLKKLEQRREIIGDFEVIGCFSYQSQPYDQVARCMQLFAKEVGPELKSWTPQTNSAPVDVNAVTASVTK